MQNIWRILVASTGLVILTSAAVSQTVPKDLRQYAKALKANGMAAIAPPSSMYRPGYIYKIVNSEQGRVVRTVCDRVFLTAPISAAVSLPKTHRFSDTDVSLGFKLLPGGVAEKLSAALGFKLKSAKTVDVTFNEVEQFEIPTANMLDPDTSTVRTRVVNPACMATLNSLTKTNGKYTESIYLVIRSVTAKSFDFTFDKDSTTGFSLSGALDGVASGETGLTIQKKTDQTFSVNSTQATPLYIAADIVRLDRATRLSQIASGVRANLAVSKATEGDMNLLAADANFR